MHARTCKQYLFWSYGTSTFNGMRFDENPFTCSHAGAKKKKKKKKKGWRVSDFVFLLVVFRWQHGSEGVNYTKTQSPIVSVSELRSCVKVEVTVPKSLWSLWTQSNNEHQLSVFIWIFYLLEKEKKGQPSLTKLRFQKGHSSFIFSSTLVFHCRSTAN